MTKLLIVHGAGMNMRGKAQIDVFGPMTLAQYDDADTAVGAGTGAVRRGARTRAAAGQSPRTSEPRARA